MARPAATDTFEPPAEIAPSTVLYRSIGHVSEARPRRPHLRDLLRGHLEAADREEQRRRERSIGAALRRGAAPAKLGWFEGVLVPCLLNIWGVIMFLRLGWTVGQAGVGLALLIIVCANVVTTITALSMCAICSNGEVQGGGAYFLISRALGPEFGGSIGLLFYCAQAIAVSMYSMGFAESLAALLEQQGTGPITGSAGTDLRVFSIATIFLLLGVALVGIGWYARCQIALLATLVMAIVAVAVGAFLPGLPSAAENSALGFDGITAGHFVDNLSPHFGADADGSGVTHSFATVFAVFFPAVTGIMAGANMSGDLQDPSRDIPKGTLLAIGISFVTYAGLAMLLGAVCTRSGLISNKLIMQAVAVWSPLLYVGVFAATLSSALASIVGAPRILQAVAKDGIFYRRYQFYSWRWLNFFAGPGSTQQDGNKTHQGVTDAESKSAVVPATHLESALAGTPGAGADLEGGVSAPAAAQCQVSDNVSDAQPEDTEPTRGYIFTAVIASLCCLAGDLDAIAPLISNFFMISYGLTNWACFVASTSKAPGWRPAFAWYSPMLSLFGALLCLLVMFAMDWQNALASVVIGGAIYKHIELNPPKGKVWHTFSDARKYVEALRAAEVLQRLHSGSGNGGDQDGVLSDDDENSESDGENGESDDNAQFRRAKALAKAPDDHRIFAAAAPSPSTVPMKLPRSIMRDAPVKTYRPQFLVLIKDVDSDFELVRFVSRLRQGHGLAMVSQILIFGTGAGGNANSASVPKNSARLTQEDLTSSPSENTDTAVVLARLRGARKQRRKNHRYLLATERKGRMRRSQLQRELRLAHLFCEVVAAPTLLRGFESLLSLTGLGRMRPNVVILGYMHRWPQHPHASNFDALFRVALAHGLGVIVLRDSNRAHREQQFQRLAGDKGASGAIDSSSCDGNEAGEHGEQAAHGGTVRGSATDEDNAGRNEECVTRPTAALSPSMAEGCTSAASQPTITSPTPATVATPGSIASERSDVSDIDSPLSEYSSPASSLGSARTRLQHHGGGVAADGRTPRRDIGAKALKALFRPPRTPALSMPPARPSISRDGSKAAERGEQWPREGYNSTPTGAIPPQPPQRFDTPSDSGQSNQGHKASSAGRQPKPTIDVWWVHDDGGLTMLVPWLLLQERGGKFGDGGHRLRVFTVADLSDPLETRREMKREAKMVHLLSKLRIKAEVTAIGADLDNPASAATLAKPTRQLLHKLGFGTHLPPPADRRGDSASASVTDATPSAVGGDRHGGIGVKKDERPVADRIAIRAALLGDLVRQHSSSAALVVVTLPLPAPRKSGAPYTGQYLAAMEVLSYGLPPTIMMRGNNQNVVTFSS